MDSIIIKEKLNEKLILDSMSYEMLLSMLKSTEEDAIVALTMLNNVNQKESLIYTLFLRKNTGMGSLWEKHCPKVVKYHSSLGFNDLTIKYSDMFKILKTLDDKEKNLTVFFKEFALFIKNTFGFIDELNIQIKLKLKDE